VTRTAAELGEGLAPARSSRAIAAGERIHILGIAGAGASAAALLAHAAGAEVSGCDPGGPSPYTPAVEAVGIPITWSHDSAHVAGDAPPDRLAVTKALTAIDPHNAELVAAVEREVPIEPWQQVVADAAHGRKLIAVGGTHGKSTTAGWLTWVLAEGGLDPSAFVGALLSADLTGGVPGTARVGRGAPFVVEADEYAGNFDAYWPDLVALTTIEFDHPDVFADLAAVVGAFEQWLRRVPRSTMVANIDDPGVEALMLRLGRSDSFRPADISPGPARVVGVAVDSLGRTFHADYVASILQRTATGTTVEIADEEAGRAANVDLPTSGDHNVANAVVVAAAALELGLPLEAVTRGLASFPGIGRRLERKGEARDVVVYDDYGHHPTAIRATIAALRQREPGRRLWAVYEPLTFHRTAAMLDEFAAALAEADAVAVADIWASRDPDTTITSPGQLAAAVRERRPDINADAPGSVEVTAQWLASRVKPGDAVLVMGGGRSYRIAELLLEALGANR
jgi:UDP-N-acetylmuramate--alanine ligase